MTRDSISVGLLLDSVELPAWQYYLIQQLLASKHTHLKLIIFDDTESDSMVGGRRSALYRAFQRRDRTSRDISHNACENKNITDLSCGIKQLQLREYLTAAQSRDGTRRALEASDLDVILALGNLRTVDRICSFATYGVWFFWHDYGQACFSDGSAVGFWEVLKRRPHIRSALMIRRTGAPGDLVAYESYSGIDHLSHSQTRNWHLWKMLFFVPRALQRLREMGAEHFLSGLRSSSDAASIEKAIYKWRMTNFRLLFPVVSYVLWRLSIKALRKFYKEKWILMFTLSEDCENLARFKTLFPPRDRFWADPYVLRRNDDFYIFFEDASWTSGHGHISVIKMTENGECSPATPVIEKPYHLSYPFVFEWNSETFMIPESSDNNSIELYRCEDFPSKWGFEYNLMEDLSAYDTTLVEHDGIWWMFTNIKQHPGGSSWDELCLFYANSPISRNWRPHPLNPVISDVRSARPAGRLFTKDGRLYRPSQNSSRRYGYGLNINEILELTTTTYSEQVARIVEANVRGPIRAVHTLSRSEPLVTVDAIYRLPTRRWDMSHSVLDYRVEPD